MVSTFWWKITLNYHFHGTWKIPPAVHVLYYCRRGKSQILFTETDSLFIQHWLELANQLQNKTVCEMLAGTKMIYYQKYPFIQ